MSVWFGKHFREIIAHDISVTQLKGFMQLKKKKKLLRKLSKEKTTNPKDVERKHSQSLFSYVAHLMCDHRKSFHLFKPCFFPGCKTSKILGPSPFQEGGGHGFSTHSTPGITSGAFTRVISRRPYGSSCLSYLPLKKLRFGVFHAPGDFQPQGRTRSTERTVTVFAALKAKRDSWSLGRTYGALSLL